MTLEESKVQNNKNTPHNENDFSKEVFDILKKYEDKPIEKKYFSMVKSSDIQIHNISSFIESNIKNRNRGALGGKNTYIRKTINDSDNIIIEEARSMIKPYLEFLWIKWDIKSTLDKMNIYMWDKIRNNTDAYSDWFDIHLNESVFNKANKHQKLFTLIHELLHNISSVLVKYSYNIDSRKNWKTWKEEDLKIASNTGYANRLIWGREKSVSYWEFFNEWMTDLITIKILYMYDKGINDITIIRYIYNVNLIDKMLLHVSEKTWVAYAILLDLLIKWYFHWDYKTLQLLQNILWKEFWDTIMNQYSRGFRYDEYLQMKEKWFFDKYPFMEIRYSSPESRSNDLKTFLEPWRINKKKQRWKPTF